MENYNLTDVQPDGLFWVLFSAFILAIIAAFVQYYLIPEWKNKKKNMLKEKNNSHNSESDEAKWITIHELVKLNPEEIRKEYDKEVKVIMGWIEDAENQWQLDSVAYDIVRFSKKFRIVMDEDEVQKKVNELASLWQAKEDFFEQPAVASFN